MTTGETAYALMQRLFPLCRSLTGAGVRATFDILSEHIPITRTEVPTGTQVFDWTVPDEWNIRDAYVAAADGTRVIDFRESSLHVVSYSEPVRATIPLEQLREQLFTLPEQPEEIPYRTSYYSRTWGFCLPHRRLAELEPGDYEVVIDSTLGPGHLTYGEVVLDGAGDQDVLISTYVCHPSLANDNLSGIVGRRDAGEGVVRAAAASHLPVRVRPRHDRPADMAAREPGHARPDRARADRLLHRRHRRPDVQAQPPRRRRRRPRRRDAFSATRAGRTESSNGIRGAATSASSARRGSTCRSGR